MSSLARRSWCGVSPPSAQLWRRDGPVAIAGEHMGGKRIENVIEEESHQPAPVIQCRQQGGAPVSDYRIVLAVRKTVLEFTAELRVAALRAHSPPCPSPQT